nr:MAG TPA: type IV like pilin [Caudoviricetes sp.]
MAYQPLCRIPVTHECMSGFSLTGCGLTYQNLSLLEAPQGSL